jgi:multidrug efflux system membrane fusion protein
MAKRLFAGFGVLLCLALLGLWWLDLGSGPPHAAAQAAPPEVPVTAGVVIAQDVPQFLQGIGTVQAFNTVAIKTRVDGAIVRVAFTEGQEVRQGAQLLQIDPRPYEAALALAMAAKEKDQAQLATAQGDLARYGRLVGPGFQTRQSYEQQQGLVAQLQAAIKGDEAQIDTARVNLGYTNIRSPIDGRLGARLIDIGNIVRTTDNAALVSITQIRPIFVSFTLPQDELDQIRQQQQKAPLDVTALASDGSTVLGEGQLSLIDNMIDQATGTIHLKATFPNADERLWPGEFVNLRMVLRMRREVATVPAQTVQEGPAGHYAYVISSNDTVERRPVEVAAVQNGLAVVSKGLRPGEHVVVDGQYRLTDGTRVRLLPPKTAGSPG